jgi:hypothetical protein
MIAFIIYLLKVSVCMAAFYLLYFVVLKRITFFSLNRFYLAGTLIAAFIIPQVHLPVVTEARVIPIQFMLEKPFHESLGVNVHVPDASADFEWSYSTFISIVYAIGVAFMAFRFAGSILSIIRIRKHATTDRIKGQVIFRTSFSQPFSFFHLIFIPAGESDPWIVRHEKVHVDQFHWIDLVLTEIAVVILWFNPVVFLYRNALRLQHEYIADRVTIQRGADLESYINCIMRHAASPVFAGPASPFNSSSIKNRILMLTQKQTSARFYAAYFPAAAVIMILLMAFSLRPVTLEVSIQSSSVVGAGQGKPSIAPVDLEKVSRVFLFGGVRNWYTNQIQIIQV